MTDPSTQSSALVSRAIVLAAGRGERMRPLTDHTPKPLLVVQGRPLIEWHLLALARAGVRDVVINTAWLEEQFPTVLGNGNRFGLRLTYAFEGRDFGGALETAGGIATALDHLGEVFWVVSGDVFLPGFDFANQSAHAAPAVCDGTLDGQLWMVRNAPHHPKGDFWVDAQGRLRTGEADQSAQCDRRTWASVGLFRREPFAALARGQRLPLRPVLERSIEAGRLGGIVYEGAWTDVGTVERLAELNRSSAASQAGAPGAAPASK
jgi:N-acetyl-alpha-D-muramate 1-phosphate uridylyltransferase